MYLNLFWLAPAATVPYVWVLACVPALALAIDRLLGEPPACWHPVVWMGRWLGWAGVRLAPCADAAHVFSSRRIFILAALFWSGTAAAILACTWLLQAWLLTQPDWLAAVMLAVCFKPLLAWAMLRDEVLAVDAALVESLPMGRTRLARLVSRDTTPLSELAVREAAIESLAENLNDSLVAPLFWFVLLGLPGAALFRFANTADAMWGYRGVRGGHDWTFAGKWAARADDVLAWLPARATGVLISLLGGRCDWRRLHTEVHLVPSPNGGWPMGAMALVLGVRLGKPGAYVLNRAGRNPESTDVLRACQVGSRVALAAMLTACGVLLTVLVIVQ